MKSTFYIVITPFFLFSCSSTPTPCETVECNGTCCEYGQVCHGNVCCTPITCESENYLCDPLSDGCGSDLDCGTCTDNPNSSCNNGTCDCTPDDCDSLNAICGSLNDGCGSLTTDCGTCEEYMNSFCNKGTCDCTPDDCTSLSAVCGTLDDGCGGVTTDCGDCGLNGSCNITGTCDCNTGYAGSLCEDCAGGYRPSGNECVLKFSDEEKWLASDGAVDDEFGYSVSISGNYAIVGAPGKWQNVDELGSAYIFHFDGTSWEEQQKIMAADGEAGDRFGISVSISGDNAIVGAIENDDKGEASGSVYIFNFDGSNWTEQQMLLASDGEENDNFGNSVSISGNYAIIGAPAIYKIDNNTGSAYIFYFDGSNWVEQSKVLPSDGAPEDRFGDSVSISGNYAIVGAAGNDYYGINSGSAYIFHFNGTNWVEQQKLVASDGAETDWFGLSVSISGNYAIVGNVYDDVYLWDSGSAYIYHFDGTNWVEQQKLIPLDGDMLEYYGGNVSISGNYAIVSASGDNDNGDSSGSVYIYLYDGTNWEEQQKILASDGAEWDQFGLSVTISSEYAIVGARGDDDNGNNSGSAYIFY